jgi:hypothetical protein
MARNAKPDCGQYTANSIIGNIDNLPPDKQRKLFGLLFKHPGNDLVREFAADTFDLIRIWERLREFTSRRDRSSSLLEQLRHAEELHVSLSESVAIEEEMLEAHGKALVQLADSVPKRRMSPERIATAEAYLGLRGQSRTRAAALEVLVNLPSEREKQYARRYRESKDTERLRQYVKQLMATYKKHTEPSEPGVQAARSEPSQDGAHNRHNPHRDRTTDHSRGRTTGKNRVGIVRTVKSVGNPADEAGSV